MAPEIAPNIQQHGTLLNTGLGSSYNISFNLSSIFTYPSRFLARMIQKGDSTDGTSLEIDPSPTSLWDTSSTIPAAAATATVTAKSTAGAAAALFPGPWGFFSSGYIWGLLIMGVMMHRIDNIFVPTTTNTFRNYTARLHPPRRGSLLNRFLPIDTNRTSTRLAIHLPTIYFMTRILFLWGILLLQTADLFPWMPAAGAAESNLGYFDLSNVTYRLGTWASSWEMEDVCWHTFCAICAAFCVEGFVKSLDGNGFGFGFVEHMQANTSPFNLVGYAFLLHIYSSPLTHAYKTHSLEQNGSNVLPSRPDSPVLITLAIPLLQLTLFHILSVRKRWSRHRLLPTALASVLSLMHFHVTLIRYMMDASSSSPSSSSADSSSLYEPTLPSQYTYTPRHAPHGYPLLNYIPNMFETLLLCTIFLTIFLNVITQLLLTGRVDKPLLGLGIGHSTTSEGWSETIPWDEDFGVVLLRVGTASLEATGLRGWGNEVTGVVAAHGLDDDDAIPRKYGSIRLTRAGVLGVSPGSVSSERIGAGARGKGKGKMRTKMLTGWDNEVRDVDLGTNSTSPGSRRRRWGINGIFTLNVQWLTELKRFTLIAFGVMFGAVKVGWEVLRGRRKLFQSPSHDTQDSQRNVLDRRDTGSGQDHDDEEDDEYDYRRKEAEEEYLYQRFLRGEYVSDDDDEEYDSPETDKDEEGTEEDDEDAELETVRLYADLANRESTPGASTTSAMLAHMSYSGLRPLTRRRYGALNQNQNQNQSAADSSSVLLDDDFDILDVRASGSGSSSAASSEADEARRNCVICTTDARVIICWPCRCLAMCDSCRETLAARSSASKHRCPCCRRGVEGYSRIYIP